MNDIAGTPIKVSIDGTPFDVMSDTNINETGSNIENSSLPTSGRTMRKQVKRAPIREGVVIACNGAERDILRDFSTNKVNVPLSYELASGDVYRAVGWIEFENRETEEYRATVQLHPEGDWESFLE